MTISDRIVAAVERAAPTIRFIIEDTYALLALGMFLACLGIWAGVLAHVFR